MCGVNEFNNKYIKKINKALNNSPDYIRGFVDYMNNASITTKYCYMLHVINFINKINKPIECLTFDDFSSYISNSRYKHNGEACTSSYRIIIYSALKKFNKYLFTTKRISDNYMLHVERPKSIEGQETISKREKGFLTKEEIEYYIQTVKNNNINKHRKVGLVWNKRDLAIIKIFLSTGIRCSALNKLDISSIDFENKTLIVTDKGEKVRLFELSDELINDINEWLNIRKEKINDNNIALFISNRRNRMSQISIYNVVNKYSKNINNKHITPHKLRATYGTQLYNETGDIYFVQDCMGHSNPKTTELYVRGKKQNSEKAMCIMSKLIN